MSLTARQTALYTDTCDIYNPTTPSDVRLPYNDVRGLIYPATPTYSSQKYFRQTGPEIERGKFTGRNNREDTVSLMDIAHFDVALDIQPNAVIHHTASNDPDSGSWFIVSANSSVKNYRANKQLVYVKRLAGKPQGIA